MLRSSLRLLLLLAAVSILPAVHALPTGLARNATAAPRVNMGNHGNLGPEPTSLLGRHYTLAKRGGLPMVMDNGILENTPLSGVSTPGGPGVPGVPGAPGAPGLPGASKAAAVPNTNGQGGKKPAPAKIDTRPAPQPVERDAAAGTATVENGAPTPVKPEASTVQSETKEVGKREVSDVNYLSDVGPAGPVVPAPSQTPDPASLPPPPPPPPPPPHDAPQYSAFAWPTAAATPPPPPPPQESKKAQNKTKGKKGKGKKGDKQKVMQ
ncbi:hypothetical protein EIP91_001408 [Steccherinum ochraceum]|uniref:Uncharacterized protein n=1 Tax=Steccherinum ochraceum TaxID=92696 RepID=A0A4V2MWJ2_9APHY|nr:hypothetical protein EIP91_001408 [Steccherinum ochraceum]